MTDKRLIGLVVSIGVTSACILCIGIVVTKNSESAGDTVAGIQEASDAPVADSVERPTQPHDRKDNGPDEGRRRRTRQRPPRLDEGIRREQIAATEQPADPDEARSPVEGRMPVVPSRPMAKLFDLTRSLFITALKLKYLPLDSTNDLILQNHQRLVKEKLNALRGCLAAVPSVVDWETSAVSVEVADDGTVSVRIRIAALYSPDDEPLAILHAKFTARSDHLVSKLKTIETPCLVKVSGMRTPQNDADFLDDEFCKVSVYLLTFDLTSIEPLFH